MSQKPTPNKNQPFLTKWMDLIDAGETLLRAGLRADYGPEQVEAAYRAWRKREREERDQNLDNLLSAISRSENRQ